MYEKYTPKHILTQYSKKTQAFVASTEIALYSQNNVHNAGIEPTTPSSLTSRPPHENVICMSVI